MPFPVGLSNTYIPASTFTAGHLGKVPAGTNGVCTDMRCLHVALPVLISKMHEVFDALAQGPSWRKGKGILHRRSEALRTHLITQLSEQETRQVAAFLLPQP